MQPPPPLIGFCLVVFLVQKEFVAFRICADLNLWVVPRTSETAVLVSSAESKIDSQQVHDSVS